MGVASEGRGGGGGGGGVRARACIAASPSLPRRRAKPIGWVYASAAPLVWRESGTDSWIVSRVSRLIVSSHW